MPRDFGEAVRVIKEVEALGEGQPVRQKSQIEWLTLAIRWPSASRWAIDHLTGRAPSAGQAQPHQGKVAPAPDSGDNRAVGNPSDPLAAEVPEAVRLAVTAIEGGAIDDLEGLALHTRGEDWTVEDSSRFLGRAAGRLEGMFGASVRGDAKGSRGRFLDTEVFCALLERRLTLGRRR